MTPLGVVRSPRTEVTDDDWGDVVSTVELDPVVLDQDATAGLEEPSHVDVVHLFDRVDEDTVQTGARHPRGNPEWPLVGILAQRAEGRPDRIGVTTCELVEVDGLTVVVRGLDAVDGTPVLDLEPYMAEFAPRTPVRQPAWSRELMASYW